MTNHVTELTDKIQAGVASDLAKAERVRKALAENYGITDPPAALVKSMVERPSTTHEFVDTEGDGVEVHGVFRKADGAPLVAVETISDLVTLTPAVARQMAAALLANADWAEAAVLIDA